MEMQQLIKEYFSSIGIAVKTASLLERGTNKNTYRMEAGKKFYILKLFDAKMSSRIQQQIQWLRLAHKIDDIAICPLNESLLRIGGKEGYYYEYFPGKPVMESNIPNVFPISGRVVGRFDKAMAKVESFEANAKFWKENEEGRVKATVKSLQGSEDSYLEQLAGTIQKAYSLAESGLKKADIKGCRTQLIHSDLHFNNILFDRKANKFRVIDLDGLNPGLLAQEIAVTMSYALTDDAGQMQEKHLAELLKAYDGAVQLLPEEKSLIPLLVIKRKITEFMWLYNKWEERHFSREEFDRYHVQTIRNLKSAVENYEELKYLVRI